MKGGARNSTEPSLAPPFSDDSRRAGRLDSDERACRFVSQKIQQTVGPLSHFTNPLLQLVEKRLPPRRQTALVQHDHLQLLAHQSAHEDISPPLRKPLARVERHS